MPSADGEVWRDREEKPGATFPKEEAMMIALPTPTQFVGVDWSGAAKEEDAAKAIWTAVVRDGLLCELSRGRGRAETAEYLVNLKKNEPTTVVGLDFAFSLPGWWLSEQGFTQTADLWEWAAARDATDPLGWLRELPEPFWGTQFRLKPVDAFRADRPEFRLTENDSMIPGATPMSTFRLFGPGTVGAQGLRGQPHLLRLKKAGYAIWPFDGVAWPLVVEVFPRLLVRQLAPDLVQQTGDGLRGAFLDQAPEGFAGEGGKFRQTLLNNQDAFDAAATGWALWCGRETLGGMTCERPDYRLEGRIWHLPDSADAMPTTSGPVESPPVASHPVEPGPSLASVPSTREIGRSGEFYVAAELNRRGIPATTFAGDLRGYDLAVILPNGSAGLLQVKAKRVERYWLGRPNPDHEGRDDRFWVFADVPTTLEASPRFYVVPEAVALSVHRTKDGFGWWDEHDISEWEDRWDVIAPG